MQKYTLYNSQLKHIKYSNISFKSPGKEKDIPSGTILLATYKTLNPYVAHPYWVSRIISA
jgi:hypothetical protein